MTKNRTAISGVLAATLAVWTTVGPIAHAIADNDFSAVVALASHFARISATFIERIVTRLYC